jgi:hypothetical protein
MAYQATTGIGVPCKMTLDVSGVFNLSLTGTSTHQLTPNVTDVAGTVIQLGTTFTLTAAANASGGSTVYTGTITGGASNAFVDYAFVVAGFDTAANNGNFFCTASSATTLTLDNAAGVADTHAATATAEELTVFAFTSYNPSVATVSNTGLVTAVGKGQAQVECGFPFGNNACGTIASTGNPNNGLPVVKIVKRVIAQVGV